MNTLTVTEQQRKLLLILKTLGIEERGKVNVETACITGMLYEDSAVTLENLFRAT